jgi:NADH-quinone oxidoreductase subunit M
MWCFPLVFTGFAILAGMWPFHTWAPTGHVAAPTAASMLLAGVVMKLGAYGCLRVGIGCFRAGSIRGDSRSSASARGATSLRCWR